MGASAKNQQDYWFRNDDGTIADATYMGAQGSNQTLLTGTANKFRIRLLVEETANGNFNLDATLYAEWSGDPGVWFDVTTTSNYLQAVGSDFVIADDAATVQDLTYSGTFVNGRYDEDGVVSTSINIKSEFTEVEFCIYIVDADVSDADTITLRVYDDTAPLNATYNADAVITVDKPAGAGLSIPIAMHHYKLLSGSNN